MNNLLFSARAILAHGLKPAMCFISVCLVSSAKAALFTLDCQLAGQLLNLAPTSLAVSNGIPGSVETLVASEVPGDSYVQATLLVPSFPARRLVGASNAPLVLPPLNLLGDDSRASIRLASATNDTLLASTPISVLVKVLDKLLVLCMTSRPLTFDDIQERGIDLDESNFPAVQFEVGFVIERQKFPVIVPSRSRLNPQAMVFEAHH